MLEQRIMKCPSRSWLWVSAALLIAVGCSLNPRPEDPGWRDEGSDIPGNLGAPSHSPADASAAPLPGTGGSSNQGGFGGGFTGGGGAGASGPAAGTDGAAAADDAAGPSEAGADALDGGADASDAARGDGG